MLGMTGRFHRSWADWGGLKHPDALRFECGGILATGGAVSIGDQLHPRGRLNGAVYEVIGDAFRDVEKVEPYCKNVKPEVQIAVLVLDPGADKANHVSVNAQPSAAAGMVSAATDNLEGACKMLLELHHQFDVITDRTCPDFSKYEMIVLPDRAYGSAATVARLKEYAANGGKLFVSHEALMEGDHHLLSDELGVHVIGRSESVPDYFVVDDARLQGRDDSGGVSVFTVPWSDSQDKGERGNGDIGERLQDLFQSDRRAFLLAWIYAADSRRFGISGTDAEGERSLFLWSVVLVVSEAWQFDVSASVWEVFGFGDHGTDFADVCACDSGGYGQSAGGRAAGGSCGQLQSSATGDASCRGFGGAGSAASCRD